MGYSTDLFCNIHYNRKTYNSKSEVEEDLASVEESIRLLESKIHSLTIMTEPQKFFNEDVNLYDFIEMTTKNALCELEDCFYEKFRLNLLIENWDYCHNKKGLAIPIPKKYDRYDVAFLDGDYIKTTRDRKEEEDE